MWREGARTERKGLGRSGKMWYLCYFLHRLLDYRLPEIEALAKLHGYSDGQKVGQGLQWKQAPDHHPDSPFYYVNLPNEDIARKVATQSEYSSLLFYRQRILFRPENWGWPISEEIGEKLG